MQFGLELGGYWRNDRHDWENLFPEFMNVVKKVDEIGLDAIVIGEHHFMDYGCTPAPLALISHIASFVSIPRLISAILMLPMHDAAVMAGEIAQADHLTRGRLEFGPSRGGGPYEYQRAGRPADEASTRRNFEEQFMVLRRLLTEKNVTYNGEFVNLDNATIMPPVFRKPHPPIWQTCQREEAAFHCAKNGYHIFTSSLRRPISYVAGLRKAFDAGVAESSKLRGEQEFAHLQWVYVAKDTADAREKMQMVYKKQRQFWGLWINELTVDGGRIPEVDMPDTIEDVAKGLIVGTKDYVEDRLLELAELGTDLMVMKTGFGQSNADELASYDRLAEFVLPKLHTPKRVPDLFATQRA
jgi:alkanesulfonate monooxygenase SsuD/methylene tetrahydromethanopterin reductase-like flavin-dependent oxidoreductase (luciferase family)